MTTDDIARAVRAATAHLRAHPEDGRVADRPATVVVADELCCRATDPLGHTVVTDMPAELGGADTGPTPGTLLRMALGACAATTLAMPSSASPTTAPWSTGRSGTRRSPPPPAASCPWRSSSTWEGTWS